MHILEGLDKFAIVGRAAQIAQQIKPYCDLDMFSLTPEQDAALLKLVEQWEEIRERADKAGIDLVNYLAYIPGL